MSCLAAEKERHERQGQKGKKQNPSREKKPEVNGKDPQSRKAKNQRYGRGHRNFPSEKTEGLGWAETE
jgi:hypothetical protein